MAHKRAAGGFSPESAGLFAGIRRSKEGRFFASAVHRKAGAADIVRVRTFLDRDGDTRCGEIDIIAREGETLVFIEVKARTSNRYGSAKAAVTPHKQRQVSKVALTYLQMTDQSHVKARFDVVTVTQHRGAQTIDLIRNAFGLTYG